MFGDTLFGGADFAQGEGDGVTPGTPGTVTCGFDEALFKVGGFDFADGGFVVGSDRAASVCGGDRASGTVECDGDSASGMVGGGDRRSDG